MIRNLCVIDTKTVFCSEGGENCVGITILCRHVRASTVIVDGHLRSSLPFSEDKLNSKKSRAKRKGKRRPLMYVCVCVCAVLTLHDIMVSLEQILFENPT